MSLTARTDVTAVKFFKNFILAGIGSYVNVFGKQFAQLLERKQCLNGQKIHGIITSKCGTKVLVFGGKQFTVLLIEASKELSVARLFDPVLCDDWIHTATWINNNTVAFLTAHNAVQKWSIANQEMLSHHKSSDNSILYSGLLLPVLDDLIVFAGTVFSEIIIHRCGEDRALHRLVGHRGVIFSICCDPQKSIIVTTSDDRSVRIWSLNNPAKLAHDTVEFWENTEIKCSHEVYGHVARVMRSIITNEYIVSCGEDAGICFWSIDGKFIRKVYHQTSAIWSVDADNNHIVTGGGDSGIILHPLTVVTDYYSKELLDTEANIKKVQFTARNNIVIANGDDELIYYDVKTKIKTVHRLSQKSSYKMLSLSSCKQLVAVADMTGCLKVYVENCKEEAKIQMLIDTEICIDKLMSTHWAGNRHIVFCSYDGRIIVLAANGEDIDIYSEFTLPQCRERYLTAVAKHPTTNMFVCGDRCGNIHCFVKGQNSPVKTLKKVQGSYGATSIIIKNNILITTGRLGYISYHSLEKNFAETRCLTERKLEFDWIEKFLDKDENIVCGFQEKKFVVCDVKSNTRILEVPCGGGHRPWDAIRFFEQVDNEFEEFIRLIYIQNSNVFLVTSQLSKIVSKPVVNGSHSKIIHCLASYKASDSMTYYISGGEDTTVRISSMTADFEFQDQYVYKQLSNIRCLKTFPMKDNQLLIITAGGRAQLCINILKFVKCSNGTKISCEQLVDFMLKGDDEERKRLKSSRDQEYDFNPETRMMDLDAIKLNENKFLIFVGCSDTILRVYMFDMTTKDICFRLVEEIEYHKTCILKTACIKFNGKDLVVTATTRGDLAFWNVTNYEDKHTIEPFDNSLNINNSGSNSFDYKIYEDKLVIAVGGDDNAISMLLLKIESTNGKTGKLTAKTLNQIKIDQLHCSQITGLVILDDFMISTSIDQRITVCEWRVVEDEIQCRFLRQVFSDVADIAGLHLLDHNSDSATVCVFGKGLEVLKLDLRRPL